MRFKLIYEGDLLPIDYRNYFMKLIKDALNLSEEGKEYLDRLYHYEEDNIEKTNKAPKPFCFAIRFQHDKEEFKKEKNIFYLKSPVEFYISSLDINFLVILYNGLINKKLYPYKVGDGIISKIINITLLKEKIIKDNKAIFKTLSPILIEDKNKNPLLPIDSDGDILENTSEKFVYFLREFNYLIDSILKGIRGEGIKERIELRPIKIRKEVIKHRIREKNEEPCLYTFTCFSGVFELSGNPEDLDYLQKIGIGLRRAQGFGMVEVV
ncbi:MAG: CRISPR-associated endoribonuclease Cas6 [Dictyoglomus sp.]|nr:CRISPR-associated endoribonuclease Cas6 [Dictyoglomus sp.]MDW8189165.1 CRISPR-associated endoribonuclease Cas6 [Dictyoglomus sp.]